jgi:hypothetical protein
MQEFTNEVINIDLLPKYQEVKLTVPHPTYWKVILLNITVTIALLVISATILILLIEKNMRYAIYAIGGLLILFGLLLALYRASFKKRGFALREKDIIFKSGIIAETTSIIPLNRIQHVAIDEGAFSRMYKLATLQIHTAGATGKMHIAGIPIVQARSIKEALLKKIDVLENLKD